MYTPQDSLAKLEAELEDKLDERSRTPQGPRRELINYECQVLKAKIAQHKKLFGHGNGGAPSSKTGDFYKTRGTAGRNLEMEKHPINVDKQRK